MDEVAAKPQPGHYVVVWRKQSNGTWKVVLDVPVSDPPEADARDRERFWQG